MIQIFALGASSVYGVGGEVGGWADVIKQRLHAQMYSKDGLGEVYEMFNFGKSGATIDFVLDALPQLFSLYARSGKIITLLTIGGNDAKAIGEADNYVSSPAEYSLKARNLLQELQRLSSHVIVVGGGYYDETKTNPKISPFSGNKSYFTNQRKKLFEDELQKVCVELKISFVGVETDENTWKEKYVYADGLHPNQEAYNNIAEKVMKELFDILHAN